ncbi:lipid droplet-associated hydrolase isoform X2 [Pimephales promelas]|uniref:lipid droplet-associated hydrolase isoform X2 n=1 Tax=Pimephales promelas TaxID=90988 RepID=UPI001955E29B|nr:lipid droplet-associated hydrolase isoform X2 [Pimephales promelas]KAG1972550.1 alpha/beta-Hydrolases superfamily protein [Pimephales promelas]
MVFALGRLPVNVIASLITNFLRSQTLKRISSFGPELCGAGPVDVMRSPGSEEPGEDPSVEYVYCRGVITELLKYGPTDLHAVSKGPKPPKMLILVIPGNPGVVGFYKTYMRTLYQTFLQRYPVWAVSHAGHCMPPETFDMIEDASVTEKDVFGLDGQIEHKLAFLQKHVPQGTNLLLIGHSIGCYIILEMIKRDPDLKVVKAVMLFPTIERMACSPQGKVMTPVLCRLRYAFYLPVFLLSLLPERLKISMVHLALRNLYTLDPSIIPSTVSLINVDCAANGMYMGSQEMRLVVERDNATIRQHLSKIIFYYGATDHWCPVQYYHDIRNDFPEGDIRLCERGIRHAFVLDSGEEMANMTAEWILDDLKTL